MKEDRDKTSSQERDGVTVNRAQHRFFGGSSLSNERATSLQVRSIYRDTGVRRPSPNLTRSTVAVLPHIRTRRDDELVERHQEH